MDFVAVEIGIDFDVDSGFDGGITEGFVSFLKLFSVVLVSSPSSTPSLLLALQFLLFSFLASLFNSFLDGPSFAGASGFGGSGAFSFLTSSVLGGS